MQIKKTLKNIEKMIKDLNTVEEVKAAILATLLNTEKGEYCSKKFIISNCIELDRRVRVIQLSTDEHILTIKFDAKTPVTKRGAQKIVSLLLDCANLEDFTFLPNRLVVTDIVKACKKEKAVNAIRYRNDRYNDFPRMLEGVLYIIDGVYITVEGTRPNCFLHVEYEGLDYKIDTTFAVMQSNHDYTIIDTANEKFYSTTNPLDTLLKLTGVR